ncbi:MAG: radical SAM protein [Legionellaceae bacterium]|nr:radical SAM protein [Legionellaceae bacterium]
MQALRFFRPYVSSVSRVPRQLSSSPQSFPSTVDLNLLGRCNLNCTWCWGPEHDTAEPIRLNEWKDLVSNLQKMGTKSVIITGGEPLLKRWLPDLIKYIKSELNMRVTLSTNGILLRRKANALLPYVDDLGIPIDGPSDEINRIMRKGHFKHFDIALDAISYVQQEYPNIDLTVRTVVAKPNLAFVSKIGSVLLHSGIKPEKLRWKIYQVNPIGPRKGEILNGDWLISSEEFNQTIKHCRTLTPELNICSQPYDKHVGRYFMIFPDGTTHVIEKGNDGFPCERILGNVFNDLSMVIKELKSDAYLDNNADHGEQIKEEPLKLTYN